ncbi:hypothetical protein DKX38_013766 [Salix brachista]|uniref:Uncharacterized protein n=1 Tax=Salix brachista TaxID=2182728 RepID=A0A5N5LE00_9ROSI|nr:hypothetical protein DKX38_013766 [Salix brachista]
MTTANRNYTKKMAKTSSATPGTGSSAYLNALTLEIEKKLQRVRSFSLPFNFLSFFYGFFCSLRRLKELNALASPTQRRNLLQELFADIALEVDDRARGIIFSREEDAISPVDADADGQLCFFNLLADYYVWVPESGKQILHLILQLWSQSFASHIFSLLFHKWLFEAQLNNTEELLRFSSALVQGATNVFWYEYQ